MKTSEFIHKLKEIFHQKLQRKTGWGKDEVFEEFKDSILAVYFAQDQEEK